MRKFHNPLHAIDSTTIDLCLNQYDWAHYRKHKGAIKGTSENAVMTQIWVAMIHYLFVAYIKFLNLIDLSLTEITDRIRDTLMKNMSLLEVLSWTRKTILKPPDWNLPDQPDLFGDFFY